MRATLQSLLGESFPIEKSNDNMNLGDTAQDLLTNGNLDVEDLPTVLMDGEYEDTARTEYDFTQNLYVAALNTTLIRDKDLNSKEPTLGVHLV